MTWSLNSDEIKHVIYLCLINFFYINLVLEEYSKINDSDEACKTYLKNMFESLIKYFDSTKFSKKFSTRFG
jgi:hypothetical protein